MKHSSDLSECKSYVAAHLHSGPGRKTAARPAAVTISRQAGARGRTIGEKLQNALRARAPKDAVPWTLFDDNLVQKVLEDNRLPAELEKFMPDDSIGEPEGSINELLGRHPSLWTLFEKTVDTIARLARMGHCIIVGRGGNRINPRLPERRPRPPGRLRSPAPPPDGRSPRHDRKKAPRNS